jgi:hypothetical protein
MRNIEDELRAQDVTLVDDAELWRIKREGQTRSRQLVREGKRTQESMFLIPPDIAKKSKVRYRGY